MHTALQLERWTEKCKQHSMNVTLINDTVLFNGYRCFSSQYCLAVKSKIVRNERQNGPIHRILHCSKIISNVAILRIEIFCLSYLLQTFSLSFQSI